MTASQRATQPNRVRPGQLPKPANDNYPGRKPSFKPVKLPTPANDNVNMFRRAARTSLRRSLGPLNWVAPLIEQAIRLNQSTVIGRYGGYRPKDPPCWNYADNWALSTGLVPCGNVANFLHGNAAKTRPGVIEQIARRIPVSFTEHIVRPRPGYEGSIELWYSDHYWEKFAGATNSKAAPLLQSLNHPEVVRLPALQTRSLIANDPTLDPNIRRTVAPGRAPSPQATSQPVPDYWIYGGSRPRPGYSPSRRPPRGTKEKKTLGTAALGVKLFRALDKISEGAEVVDAIWRAIPKDKRKKKPGRPLLDAAGQYGIDGADWKLVQIYDNFGSIDWDQAVRNIIANEVEDRIIGGVQGTVKKAYRGPTGQISQTFGKQVSRHVGTVFGAN